MRIAAVGDVHGRTHLDAFCEDLKALGPVDLFLLAGDTTDRNDLDGFRAVLTAVRERVREPIWAVFGNNEYAEDHPTYAARFGPEFGVKFLQDEQATMDVGGSRVRIVGSLGCLDRPTWWQRTHRPHFADEYRRRIAVLDGLLSRDGETILLTHYPPTWATMGNEKEEWRPELGCKALEPVLLRRRPSLVIHGHIHKGVPSAELRPRRDRLDDFADHAASIPVHNVAYPVRRTIATFDV